MPRIRTIKPQFWDSPSTARATFRGRLFFIAMWNWADDYGIGTANAKQLISFAFPNDDDVTVADFPTLRKEVADAFDVVWYEVDGRPYYYVPSWDVHQRTERKAKGTNPGPDSPNAAVQSLDEGTSDGSSGFSDAPQGTSELYKTDLPVEDPDGPTTISPCLSSLEIESSATSASYPAEPAGRGTFDEPSDSSVGTSVPSDGSVVVGIGEVGSRKKKTSSPASRATDDDDPDFARFWAAYPRKVGKGEARKAWAKVIKSGVDPDVVIAGVERYRDDPLRRRKDIEYTKTPGPWLNAERWTDQLNGNDLAPSSGWWDN